MLVGEIITKKPEAEKVFKQFGMMCLGCPASQSESLQDACEVHGLNADEVLEKINSVE